MTIYPQIVPDLARWGQIRRPPVLGFISPQLFFVMAGIDFLREAKPYSVDVFDKGCDYLPATSKVGLRISLSGLMQ